MKNLKNKITIVQTAIINPILPIFYATAYNLS